MYSSLLINSLQYTLYSFKVGNEQSFVQNYSTLHFNNLQEQLLFEEIYHIDETSSEKSRKDRSPLNKTELNELLQKTWTVVR